MILTPKQTRILNVLENETHTEILFGGGAGGGKSLVGCYWLLKMCIKYPGTRWLMGRAKLDTLKKTTLATFFEVCKMQGIKAQQHYNYNAQSNVITFKNDSQIILKDLFLYPSDPNFDSLGSLEITGAFIDECNQITQLAHQMVSSRIRYKLDDLDLIPKTLLTCNPSKNWVYNEFFKPERDNTLPKYRYFLQSLVEDNPHISKHYVEQLMKMNKASIERLRFGNWDYDDSIDTLFEFDDLQDMFSNEFVEDGEMFMTVDVARLGPDKTVIGVWKGMRLEDIMVMSKSTAIDVEREVKRLSNQYSIPASRRLYDEDGVGGGVKDHDVGSKGFVNNSTPLEVNRVKENYSNLKSQCYFHLANDVNNGKIYISKTVSEKIFDGRSIKEIMIEELGATKRKDPDKDGKLSVIPKDKIKQILGRSPDFADMLMMRQYFSINNVAPMAYFG